MATPLVSRLTGRDPICVRLDPGVAVNLPAWARWNPATSRRYTLGVEALVPGETMRFVNDHDPLPLLEQLRQRYGEAVSIEYRQREPGGIVIDFVRTPAR